MDFDWGDIDAWERGYQNRVPEGTSRPWEHDQFFDIEEAHRLQWVLDLCVRQPVSTVWVPGCGLSILPALLAELGMTVMATDVSRTAISAQENAMSGVRDFVHDPYFAEIFRAAELPSTQRRSLQFLVHDCRTRLAEQAFDLIMNIKAFQGFSAADMARVAQTHYAALRPTGRLFLETQNIDRVESRILIEETLASAGFALSGSEAYRWYLRELSQSGINLYMRLGWPQLADDYWGDSTTRQEHRRRLDEIRREYEERQSRESAPDAQSSSQIGVTFMYRSG